jgi:hypothetical protein
MARTPPRRSRKKARRRDELLPAIATAAMIVVGAWLMSWWIVPVAAIVAGAIWRMRGDVATQALWGAVAGWALLLLIDSLHLRTWALGRALGGAIFLPWGLVFVATLLFAAGLAWSSATLAAFAWSRVQGRRAR